MSIALVVREQFSETWLWGWRYDAGQMMLAAETYCEFA